MKPLIALLSLSLAVPAAAFGPVSAPKFTRDEVVQARSGGGCPACWGFLIGFLISDSATRAENARDLQPDLDRQMQAILADRSKPFTPARRMLLFVDRTMEARNLAFREVNRTPCSLRDSDLLKITSVHSDGRVYAKFVAKPNSGPALDPQAANLPPRCGLGEEVRITIAEAQRLADAFKARVIQMAPPAP